MRIGRYSRGAAYEEVTVTGESDSRFEVSNGKPRLGFTLLGLLGGRKRLALYPEGDPIRIGIKDGRQYRAVRSLLFDGVRLRIA
jgi:hypothetical protein